MQKPDHDRCDTIHTQKATDHVSRKHKIPEKINKNSKIPEKINKNAKIHQKRVRRVPP
jgi:hypothetical protein